MSALWSEDPVIRKSYGWQVWVVGVGFGVASGVKCLVTHSKELIYSNVTIRFR